jgi:hypothetical protein
MPPKSRNKTSEEGYEVNIELKDQLNNVFYIDNVNDSNSIMLKDALFINTEEAAVAAAEAAAVAKAETDVPIPATSQGATKEQVAQAQAARDAAVEKQMKEKLTDNTKKIITIYRDIYYLDNTVIQDLKTIFKKYSGKTPVSRDGKSRYDVDYNDTREPVSIDALETLMKNTTELSELHKIFTESDYSKTIKDNLIHFNSGTNSRVKQLNSRDSINRYIVDYYKYINNSKKTSDFDDDEKMDALMFYNVMYLLKNIYLKKQTILTNIQGERYYVDEILFYDLPYIHMVRKDYDKPKKINVYLRIKTIPIIDIPVIKIHYIVEDLEIQSLKLSAPREFKPSDLDKDFAKYSTMYIFDKFKYKQETDSMTAFFNSLKSEKRIDKIQELFFNADIVNKYQKRYNEQHKAQKKETEETPEEKTAKDTIKYNNINANILYMLRENFNLIDNKISIDSTSIDDTYIAYDIERKETTKDGRKQSSVKVKYHSIMTNKNYNKYDNSKKEDIIKSIIADHLKRFSPVNYEDGHFFYTDDRADDRLRTTVYNIIVIFRTFKQGSSKKKPSLTRRYMGDECLSNAVTLDSIFSKLFYRTIGLPDKYLYDKLSGIADKSDAASASDSKTNTTIPLAPNIPGLPNIPIPTNGGKKHNIKKFRTKKFRVKKHNTRKYRKNKFRTKKFRTKKLGLNYINYSKK